MNPPGGPFSAELRDNSSKGEKKIIIILPTSLMSLQVILFAAAAVSRASSSLGTAIDGYIFAYPLVLVNVTLNSQVGASNTFTHARDFPAASDQTVVRPNLDTSCYVGFVVATMNTRHIAGVSSNFSIGELALHIITIQSLNIT